MADELTETGIASRLREITDRIANAAGRAGRSPHEVKLIAISKGFTSEVVAEAISLGQRVLGENRVQELLAKQQEVSLADLEWHFVGRLQRNKVKELVGRVAMVHSLDRPSLVEEILKRFSGSSDRTEFLLEVNTSGEKEKGGVDEGSLLRLAGLAISGGLRVAGLMTMAPAVGMSEDARPYFRKLAELRELLRREFGGQTIQHLSMGMSQDYEVAVEEGATLVRIGEAIFGPRARR